VKIITAQSAEGSLYSFPENVPAAAEVWERAKKNFLADKWWRGSDHPERRRHGAVSFRVTYAGKPVDIRRFFCILLSAPI